jgi:hypothetical protein
MHTHQYNGRMLRVLAEEECRPFSLMGLTLMEAFFMGTLETPPLV